jgi:hypothetical protein
MSFSSRVLQVVHGFIPHLNLPVFNHIPLPPSCHPQSTQYTQIRKANMPSELRSETSRINGTKSHGPKTPQGRAIYSSNHIKHGITAKTLLLTNESGDDFLKMMSSYFDLFQPTNQMEVDIICDIVAARWRLRRIWSYQTAMVDVEMDKQAPEFEKRYQTYDEYMRGAAAFSAIVDNSKGYVTALRTDIHLTRTYRRAVEDLRRLRGGKLLNENQIFRNEPEPPSISPLNATEATSEISTEPKP